MAISERKRRYAESRLSGKNQTESAKDAGCPAKSAHVEGSRLERDREVQAYIAAEQERLSKATGITRERWITELAAIGFSKITNFAKWGEGAMVLTPAAQVADENLRAILQVEERNTDSGPVMKLKLHDKNKALELLGRALGFFEDPSKSAKGITEIKITVEDYTTDEG
jgi:phage terminase small subunit